MRGPRDIVTKACKKIKTSEAVLFGLACKWKWGASNEQRSKEAVQKYFEVRRRGGSEIPPYVREYIEMRLNTLPVVPRRQEPANHRPVPVVIFRV